MELRILHTTTYRYQGSVDMAQHMVHLSPLDTPTQTVRAHMLTVTPEPASRSQTTDAFGNLRTFFSLQSPHETLTVTADSTVVTQAPAPLPDHPAWQAQTWESVRDRSHYRAQAPYDPASEFLFASPHVPRDDAFATFARPDFLSGRSALAAVRSLMEHIHSGLTYDSTSTEVNTPERTRKVPSKLSENAPMAKSTVQALNCPRLSVTMSEWISAVATSQGMSEAFSTGSQNHQPPQPSS